MRLTLSTDNLTGRRGELARKNRERNPEFAAFVDVVRKHAPDAKVTYFTDGKVTYGKRGPRGVQVSEIWNPPTKE